MVRSVLIAALLLAIGIAAARVVTSWPTAHDAGSSPADAPHPQRAPAEAARAAGRPPARSADELALRVQHLEAELAEESAERRRLAERLDTVTAQLAEASGGFAANANARPAASAASAPEAPGAGAAGTGAAADDTTSPMERALTAAGLDAATAAEIKERRDALTMTQMYLRDQATREQWLDSPRFQEEMAALSAQEVPIREEIGDDAYDRYLFALGDPNRVQVDDVLSHSPAAEAGLQTGDMIVRYGNDRIFAPAELVAQTRAFGEGDTVRLEIVRNGVRLEVEVPRGPLGLRVAATQAAPEPS